jgi:glucose-6-phosphate 1-dehydrogenase
VIHREDGDEPHLYAAGGWGPAEAEALIEAAGGWHNPGAAC